MICILWAISLGVTTVTIESPLKCSLSSTSKSMIVSELLCGFNMPDSRSYWSFPPHTNWVIRLWRNWPWLTANTVLPLRASLLAISLNICMQSLMRAVSSSWVSMWSNLNQPSSVKICPYSSLMRISGKISKTCVRVRPGNVYPPILTPNSSWIWVMTSHGVVSVWM